MLKRLLEALINYGFRVVGPDLAKFYHFGKIWKDFGNVLDSF